MCSRGVVLGVCVVDGPLLSVAVVQNTSCADGCLCLCAVYYKYSTPSELYPIHVCSQSQFYMSKRVTPCITSSDQLYSSTTLIGWLTGSIDRGQRCTLHIITLWCLLRSGWQLPTAYTTSVQSKRIDWTNNRPRITYIHTPAKPHWATYTKY